MILLSMLFVLFAGTPAGAEPHLRTMGESTTAGRPIDFTVNKPRLVDINQNSLAPATDEQIASGKYLPHRLYRRMLYEKPETWVFELTDSQGRFAAEPREFIRSGQLPGFTVGGDAPRYEFIEDNVRLERFKPLPGPFSAKNLCNYKVSTEDEPAGLLRDRACPLLPGESVAGQ